MIDHPEAHALKRRKDYETPGWLFDRLHSKYRFTVDACAHAGNAKLPRFWGPEQDGLQQDWRHEVVWCNPPYGAGIEKWISKAVLERSRAVFLLPCRTESAWWAEWVVPQAAEIQFIRGRVHFLLDGKKSGNERGSRPVFPSAVVVIAQAIREQQGHPIISTFQTPGIERLKTGARRSRA